MQNGRYERVDSALERLGQLRKPTPRDSFLRAQLALASRAACAALQLNAEARAWYELAISVNPLDSQSQQALFRLTDSKERQP